MRESGRGEEKGGEEREGRRGGWEKEGREGEEGGGGERGNEQLCESLLATENQPRCMAKHKFIN